MAKVAKKKKTKKSNTSKKLSQIDIGISKWSATPGPQTFNEKATLEIARRVLILFGFVLLSCFVVAIIMLFKEDSLVYDNIIDLIRTMLGSIVPLVTLAVGYYLGDKSSTVDAGVQDE